MSALRVAMPEESKPRQLLEIAYDHLLEFDRTGDQAMVQRAQTEALMVIASALLELIPAVKSLR